jgi:hypothetical protein
MSQNVQNVQINWECPLRKMPTLKQENPDWYRSQKVKLTGLGFV